MMIETKRVEVATVDAGYGRCLRVRVERDAESEIEALENLNEAKKETWGGSTTEHGGLSGAPRKRRPKAKK